MRNLGLKDVFTVSRILKKMKLDKDMLTKVISPKKPKVEGLTEEQKKEAFAKAQSELGAEIIEFIIFNIGEAEEDLYKFIADLKGGDTKPEDIESLDFEQIGELVKEFQEMKGFKGFLDRVSKSMQ